MSLKRPFRIRFALVVLVLAVGGPCTNALADSLKITLTAPMIDFPATGVIGTSGSTISAVFLMDLFLSDGSERLRRLSTGISASYPRFRQRHAGAHPWDSPHGTLT